MLLTGTLLRPRPFRLGMLWLLVTLLPIQASAGLIDGVWRPAHFHRHHVGGAPVVVADAHRVLQDDDVLAYLDAGDDATAAQAHAESAPHHHAPGETDVVYIGGDDGDPATAGLIGKRSIDAVWTLIPSWTASLATLASPAPRTERPSSYTSPHRDAPERPPR